MADPVATMTVSGLADLEEALQELGNAVAGKVLYNALMTAAIPIQDTAIAMAPQAVKPYYRYKRRGKKVRGKAAAGQPAAGTTTEREAYVGVSWQGNAFYGRFLEFGTAKMAARPFLRPAFDARSGEALGIFMDRLRENIERARRRAAAKTQGTA